MKKHLQLFVILLVYLPLFAQVGIGTTTPNSSAALDIVSTSKGVLIPRMTQAQRNLITVGATQTGLLIYQTDMSPGYYYYNGTTWTSFGSGTSWGLTGNASTTPAANKLGTTDTNDFVIKTNSTEAMRITSGGNIGIGTTTPSSLFHFVGGPGTVLLNENFESLAVAPVSTNTANSVHAIDANACSNVMDWKISNDDVRIPCPTLCSNKRAKIDYGDSSCNQNATLVLNIGVINSEAIKIDFDYVYWVFNGNESFQANLYNKTTSSIQTVVLGPLVHAGGNVNETHFSQVFSGITVGHDYSLQFVYQATDDNGVSVDNVVVSTAPISMRIDDGTQVAGHALTSDANGVATWKPYSFSGGDQDWLFFAGTTNNDPIYHTGLVKVGTPTASTRTLHIYNGATSGSTLGIGSVEYIRDGVTSIGLRYDVLPHTNGTLNLGSTTRRWVTVYTDVVSRLADFTQMTEIKPLNYGTKEIMKLNPISFKWEEERIDDFIIPENEKSSKIGFSAQELLDVIPEVVETYQWKEREENPGVLVKEAGERLSVNYSEIIPVAIKAIQEQEAKIKELENRNEKLKQLLKKYDK